MTAEILHLTPRTITEDEPETIVLRHLISIDVPSDPTPDQMMRAVETSGALDFWENPAEDIYSPEDGQPL